VFPPALEAEFLQLQAARPGLDARTPILDDYPTQLALVPAGSGLERYLLSRPDWKSVYADDQASVFIRRNWGIDVSGGASTTLHAPAIPRWGIFPGNVSTGTKVAEGLGTSAGEPRLARSAPRPDTSSLIPLLHD
jgi:hypothetical protein